MTAVAKLASPMGQWPESIHPRTCGGCMGDGQHVWAAAEWVLMIRNCFIREEKEPIIFIQLPGFKKTKVAPGTNFFELKAEGVHDRSSYVTN